MLFSARMVAAEEALHMGLVHKVVPDQSLMQEAISLGTKLATSVSPRSLGVIKQQVYDAQFQTLAEALDVADEEMRLSLESEDFKEGVAHFLEKRPPRFP
jgi:enoyl-CoA hydratase/carnithine racemase